jgi:hypothetical protein
MAERQPSREFGTRRPVASPAATPIKRSGHVGLLLMGTLAVGGGAYAMMAGENCQPIPPGMAAPAIPQSGTGCASRGSSGGGYGRSLSRLSFFGSDTSSGRSSSATSTDSGSSGVTRGGFGAFAHAFGFSGRG